MRAIAGLAMLSLAVVAACAHNVPQDIATGADGTIKGAKPLALNSGEAKGAGIVTYPGGDRVDWKVIDLAGRHGKLDLKLTWRAPRPGLQVAFDVFDQWHAPAVAAVEHNRRGSVRTASIDHAIGKYFVRIYAPKRGDAGTYRLVADFTEDPPVLTPGPFQVADPPRLAEVPPPVEVCDDSNFDIHKPGCPAFCPKFGAPAGWPGCFNICPQQQDASIVACQKVMKCPRVPDPRIEDCDHILNPPPTPLPPVITRVIHLETSGDSVLITLGIGSEQKIDSKWHAEVLRGDTTSRLPDGAVTLIRVGKSQTIAKVKLTVDLINQNPMVRLTPP